MGSLMAHEQKMIEKWKLKSEKAFQTQITVKKLVDAVKNESNSSKKGQKHKFDKRNGGKTWQGRRKKMAQIRKVKTHNQWNASKGCTDQFKWK